MVRGRPAALGMALMCFAACSFLDDAGDGGGDGSGADERTSPTPAHVACP